MTMARVGIAVTLCVSLLSANPSGHDVAHGRADVQALQNLLQITTSDKAIINWQEFSSKAGETIRFVQPSASSAVLNRVTGGNTSTLYGDLQANGQVYLVNPNGIVIGQHARIDAGAFVASTFDVLDSDFIEGSALRFFGDSKAGVVNLGTIKTNAGDCSLIGFQVENDGSVEATGQAALIASNKVILKPHDLQRIYIASDNDVSSVDNPYLLAFNQTIEKDALHFKKDDTGIFLMVNAPVATVAGQIAAESVAVLGDYVQVLDQSSIAAQNILIGGDFQGINASLPHARQTYVAKEARIKADGVEKGGKVIVWGTDAAGFYGDISAKPQGFVEISSHGLLDPQGAVDTGGGTVLFDPVDVTISAAANSNIGTFPTPNNYIFSGTPANISTVAAPTIQSFLAANNVVVATNQAGGGTGNITVSSAVSWGSAFSLTLDTTGTAGVMAINANIQNTGTGGVILNAGTGAVNISSAAAPNAVSVGSQNGPTTINAPSSVVNIHGSNGGSPFVAQLGFFTPIGGTSTGPISVTCSQLNITGGNTASAAQIGHGQPGSTANTATTASASITVNVTGDITLLCSTIAAGSAHAIIGHGSNGFDTNVASSASQAGDISVTSSAGNITLTSGATNSINSFARIGHGWFTSLLGGANRPNLTGNITVHAPAGNISMTASNPVAAGNIISIGHGKTTAPSIITTTVSSDIDVVCGGTLLMDGSAAGMASHLINIGSSCFGTQNPDIDNYSQHLRVTVGQDIIMHPSFRMFIGTANTTPAVSFFSETTVVAGRDIILNGPFGQSVIGGELNNITFPTTVGGNTSVAAGRNIVWDRSLGSGAVASFITGTGDVSVAAQGDITLTAGSASVSMGTSNRVNGGGADSTIYACGSIIATSSAAQGAVIGYDTVNLVNTNPYNVDIQAGGDIQIANGFTAGTSTTSGLLNIEADANLSAGALWGYTGSNLTSIASHALDPLFPITNTSLLPAPVNAPSSACPADQFGAFRVVATPFVPTNNVSFSTTSGNITLHSACRRLDGTLQDLNVGTVGPASTLNVVTASGNIEIAGSIPQDGFHDITLTSVANPWTSGTIYVRACNDLNQNTPVVTSGAGKFITLASDSDADGAGNVNLTQNVTTNGGPILLDAGFAAGSGASAINQTANQINSNGGSITAQAVGNITFNGAATSVTSGAGNISATSKTGSITSDQDVTTTTGNITMTAALNVNVFATGSVTSTNGGSITMTAGNDVNVNGDATSISSTTGNITTTAGHDTNVTMNVGTAGSILMISGRSMFLLAPTTSIISTAGPVTLVTDNDFPSPPGIGPGFFSSVVGSQVASGPGQPLQVFTALQGQNSIFGTLNGATFTAGTIFVNSATEQWCTYYPDPFFGGVFTVFYKDCEQVIVQTGNRVVSDMLFNLAPENMWIEELQGPLIPPEVWRFMIIYDKGVNAFTKFEHERYWLSRRNIHFIHYPYVYKENKPLEQLVPPEAGAKVPKRKKSRI